MTGVVPIATSYAAERRATMQPHGTVVVLNNRSAALCERRVKSESADGYRDGVGSCETV